MLARVLHDEFGAVFEAGKASSVVHDAEDRDDEQNDQQQQQCDREEGQGRAFRIVIVWRWNVDRVRVGLRCKTETQQFECCSGPEKKVKLQIMKNRSA